MNEQGIIRATTTNLPIYLVLCISKQRKMGIKEKIVCMAQTRTFMCSDIEKLEFGTNKAINFGTNCSKTLVQNWLC